MILGTDSGGKVLLVGSGTDPSSMPIEWNGIAITVSVLTPAQRTAFVALPVERGGTTFDGITFAPIPAVIPPPIDLSNVDNIEKALKALGLVCAAWNGKTPAQLKAAFKTAWDALG